MGTKSDNKHQQSFKQSCNGQRTGTVKQLVAYSWRCGCLTECFPNSLRQGSLRCSAEDMTQQVARGGARWVGGRRHGDFRRERKRRPWFAKRKRNMRSWSFDILSGFYMRKQWGKRMDRDE